MACAACGRANLEGGLCPNCAAKHDDLALRRQDHTAEYLTFLKIRQLLGFGPRRLKLLKWLKDHPELDDGRWHLQGNVGGSHSVEMALFRFENILVEST